VIGGRPRAAAPSETSPSDHRHPEHPGHRDHNRQRFPCPGWTLARQRTTSCRISRRHSDVPHINWQASARALPPNLRHPRSTAWLRLMCAGTGHLINRALRGPDWACERCCEVQTYLACRSRDRAPQEIGTCERWPSTPVDILSSRRKFSFPPEQHQFSTERAVPTPTARAALMVSSIPARRALMIEVDRVRPAVPYDWLPWEPNT